MDGAIWPGLLIQSNPIQSNPNAGVGGLVDGAIWPGLLSNPVQIESNPIQTQGLVGWWMVRSGLDEPTDEWQAPRVSPYRLAAHLVSAFTIFATLLNCVDYDGLEVSLFTHTHTRAHTHTNTHTHSHTHTHTYTQIHTHIHTHTYTHIHTHTYTHAHTRTHMHIRTHSNPVPAVRKMGLATTHATTMTRRVALPFAALVAVTATSGAFVAGSAHIAHITYLKRVGQECTCL